jgi:hypothetical protein
VTGQSESERFIAGRIRTCSDHLTPSLGLAWTLMGLDSDPAKTNRPNRGCYGSGRFIF